MANYYNVEVVNRITGETRHIEAKAPTSEEARNFVLMNIRQLPTPKGSGLEPDGTHREQDRVLFKSWLDSGENNVEIQS